MRRSVLVCARFFRTLAVAAAVLFGVLLAVRISAEAAIRPAFANVPESLVDQGELLISELNCVACHKAEAPVKERLASRQAPVLGGEGWRLTPQYLRGFLANPETLQPGTTMPDLLHGIEAAERAATVDALVHFVIAEQGSSAEGTARGDARPTGNAVAREDARPTAADQVKIQQGRILYHQVGCVACHAPIEAAATLRNFGPENGPLTPPTGDSRIQSLNRPAGSLSEFGYLAAKTAVEDLARFLKDSLKSRPSGRMPSMNLTEAEATAIAMYLLRAQAAAPNPNGLRAKAQGVSFQYFEGNFKETADLEKQKPKASGVADRFNIGARKNEQFFGLRLSGFISIAREGTYNFYTESDDGSRLYIGDKLVVDNDGVHGPTEVKGTIDLKPGEHPILVTFFNCGSGATLKVSYAGPGISKREVPNSALFTYDGQPMLPLGEEQFVLDSSKAARGRELFASLGCVACHQTKGSENPGAERAKAFADLGTGGGCLAENPGKGIPKYAFANEQREAIRKTLLRRSDLARALDPVQRVNHTMAVLNCFACHARGEISGPVRDRAEYFTTVGEVDLGDDGRLPPHLTRVGDKLRPEWLREVLLNKGASRPYMATRMPQFGANNVGQLIEAFEKADSGNGPLSPALSARRGERESSPVLGEKEREKISGVVEAKYGRNLVGTGGFACISCHTFASYKSLGIPAMDLTLMTKRLKPDWFHRYLLDPQSLRPGTRMPTFWPEGKSSRQDILAGNTDRQINAIWAFLSRGRDADLPPGLVQGKLELVATTEPIIYRHFLSGAGSRAIGVGYPEKANLAFDANELRLAMAWQGSFIDAARHRTGRGEGSVPPLGYNIIRFPPGAAFAVLDSPNERWPELSETKADLHLRGYVLDEQRRPKFRYAFKNIEVEDAPVPVAAEVDPYFRRQLIVRAEQPTENLWFRAWAGSKIEDQGGGAFLADGKVKLRFELAGAKPLVRELGGRAELLVPVRFQGKEARFVEEIIW